MTRDIVPSVAAQMQTKSRWRRHRLTVVLALIAIPAILLAFWPNVMGIGGSGRPNGAFAELRGSDWMTSLLAVGNVSPSGIDASKITPEGALARAEREIFSPDANSNLEERKFWLRKSIKLMLSEPQSRWAVSQLGALQTAPRDSGPNPDYKSAKALWELASASGDVVATCFLAKLYEFGLGVIASEQKAETWQSAADAKGGCNLQQERPPPALTN